MGQSTPPPPPKAAGLLIRKLEAGDNSRRGYVLSVLAGTSAGWPAARRVHLATDGDREFGGSCEG